MLKPVNLLCLINILQMSLVIMRILIKFQLLQWIEELKKQEQKKLLILRKKQRSQKCIGNKKIPTIKDSKGSINIDEQGLKCILEYELRKTIGSGGYGKVKKAWSKIKKQYFAIKIINTKKLERKLLDKNAQGLLEKEIAEMKKLIHKNVVRLYEVIKDNEKNKMYLVMEYLSKGSVMSKRYW
eukprot:TRINITY_DN7671_c0_g1_i1.p3 TRINITY_DN7671_c0_g1~~TRINITY_DN7671_c0_g1_i1.p3  ORF type:complete len:183 (-),score=27.28 TRINITY_DN7671_c0_g1_i1:745-1293(-)